MFYVSYHTAKDLETVEQRRVLTILVLETLVVFSVMQLY